MSCKLKGDREMLRRLKKLERDAPENMGAALYQFGVLIMSESVEQCPVDKSFLINSRYVSPPSMSRGHVEIELGYGKYYSIYVHEREDLTFKKRGAKSKYLQDPFSAALGKKWVLLALAESAVKRDLKYQGPTGHPTRPGT